MRGWPQTHTGTTPVTASDGPFEMKPAGTLTHSLASLRPGCSNLAFATASPTDTKAEYARLSRAPL